MVGHCIICTEESDGFALLYAADLAQRKGGSRVHSLAFVWWRKSVLHGKNSRFGQNLIDKVATAS